MTNRERVLATRKARAGPYSGVSETPTERLSPDRHRPRPTGLGHPGLPGPYPLWGGRNGGPSVGGRPGDSPRRPTCGSDPDRRPPGPPRSREVLARTLAVARPIRRERARFAVPSVAGRSSPNPKTNRACSGSSSSARVRTVSNPNRDHQPKQLAKTACVCLRFVFAFRSAEEGVSNRARSPNTNRTYTGTYFCSGCGGYPQELPNGTRAFLEVSPAKHRYPDMPFKAVCPSVAGSPPFLRRRSRHTQYAS